MDLKVTDYWNK